MNAEGQMAIFFTNLREVDSMGKKRALQELNSCETECITPSAVSNSLTFRGSKKSKTTPRSCGCRSEENEGQFCFFLSGFKLWPFRSCFTAEVGWRPVPAFVPSTCHCGYKDSDDVTEATVETIYSIQSNKDALQGRQQTITGIEGSHRSESLSTVPAESLPTVSESSSCSPIHNDLNSEDEVGSGIFPGLPNQPLSEFEDLHEIGVKLEEQGRLEDAIEAYTSSLDGKIHHLGSNDISVALTFRQMGLTHWKLGGYDDALVFLSKALAIYYQQPSPSELEDGVDHPLLPQQEEIAETFHIIGTVHHSKGAFDNRAMWYLERSLKLRMETRGHVDPNVGRTMVSIGSVHSSMGRYDRAKLSFKKGIRVLKEAVGPKSIQVASAFNCLGNVYQMTSRYDKALDLYIDALGIYRQQGSLENDVGVTLSNISQVYSHMDMFDKATSTGQEALDILVGAIGSCHRNVATATYMLASIQERQGFLNHALDLYQNALDIQKLVLSESHVDVASTLDSMGRVLEQQGKKQGALDFYWKALNVRRTVLGERHMFVAVSLHQIGEYLCRIHDARAAHTTLSKALDLYMQHGLGRTHSLIQGVTRRIRFIQDRQ